MGKTLELKATVLDSEEDDVIWRSLDTAIATIDEAGIVTGVEEGSATILCALESDYNVSARIKIQVQEGEVASPEYAIAITKPATRTAYTQGDYLDLSGLEVTVYDVIDGKAAETGTVTTEYTTNPENGAYLSKTGNIEVTVSYPSAPSVSFPIEVAPIEQNDSIQKVWTAFEAATAYKVDVDGWLYRDASSEYKFDLTAEFDKNGACFLDNEAGTAVGYGVQTKAATVGETTTKTTTGVYQFEITTDEAGNKTLVPYGYVNASSKNLSSYLDEVERFMFFDGDTAPRFADKEGNFAIKDATILTNLISFIGYDAYSSYITGGTVTAQSTTNEETGEVTYTGFTIELELYYGIIGELTYVVSEMGTHAIEILDEYVANGGGGSPVYYKDAGADLKAAVEAIGGHNYSIDLGTFRDANNEEKDGGRILFNEKYYMIEYTQDYLDYYNAELKAESEDELQSEGYVLHSNNDIYHFVISDEMGSDEVMADEEKFASTSASYGLALAYSNIKQENYFNIFYLENCSLFNPSTSNTTYTRAKETFIEVANDYDGDGDVDTYYMSYVEDYAEEMESRVFTSGSYDPYGVAVSDIVKTEEGAIASCNVLYFTDAGSGNYYYRSVPLSQFGTSENALVESYLATIA